MTEWKYSLEFEGKHLRALINEGIETLERISEIYNQIISCLSNLKKRIRNIDDYTDYKINSMIADLECAKPDLTDEELNYSKEEEKLNYYLRDFYDFCGTERVWIGV